MMDGMQPGARPKLDAQNFFGEVAVRIVAADQPAITVYIAPEDALLLAARLRQQAREAERGPRLPKLRRAK